MNCPNCGMGVPMSAPLWGPTHGDRGALAPVAKPHPDTIADNLLQMISDGARSRGQHPNSLPRPLYCILLAEAKDRKIRMSAVVRGASDETLRRWHSLAEV